MHPVVLVFLAVASIGLIGLSGLLLVNPDRKRIQGRLQAVAARQAPPPPPAPVIRERLFSELPRLNTWLARMPPMHTLARLLEKANSPYPVAVFLFVSGLLFASGFLLGALLVSDPLLYMSAALLLGLTPFVYMCYLKRQRMAKFESQLPDALDLVARSLKAGHPFRVGMKLVGDEFADPMGTEFTRTVDEMNFNVGVSEALKNLAERVDCPDLHFFATSVIVQRETGGNLATILEQTARLVRQRFEFQGRIKVLSAEGKLSAIVLVAFPFVLAFVINLLNPDHFTILFEEPLGKGMLAGGGFMMLIGIVVIKKMIKIKV